MNSNILHLALILFFCTVKLVFSCEFGHIHVQQLSSAAGTPLQDKYDIQAVMDHFSQKEIQYGSNVKNTFACVDARNNDFVFGTPGGDFSEFAAALQVYLTTVGKQPTDEVIGPLFKSFVETKCSATRPFYYHTDSDKLSKLFETIAKETNDRPTIFPWDEPANSTIWLKYFVYPEYQGCGHIRLTLQNPIVYGLQGPEIIQSLLRVLVKYWWGKDDEGKKRVSFISKLGSLTGKAVTIINTESNSSHCLKSSPLVLANVRGSSTFIYHKTAVRDFRESVLTPFFASKSKKINRRDFLTKLNELADLQLGATLGSTGLPPANQVDIFQVNVTYTPKPVRRAANKFAITVLICLFLVIAACCCAGGVTLLNLFGARTWITTNILKRTTVSSDKTTPFM